ncbi:mitotic checkpoint protein Bub3 [Brevipalpus obovatus]|uniref:mitotic checkpoint protein Bub3 n=1 Tax=Brevipalpus obovatus TaxID=246614 RepID=UPI003D9E3527
MTLSENTSEIRLENPPTDCIQSVKYGPTNSRFLIAASWDCTVRLYDTFTNKLKCEHKHGNPVLDCAFQDQNFIWSGGLDQQVKIFDIERETETVAGSHTGPVRCVEYASEVNVMLTGGWDSCVKMWDPRTPNAPGSLAQPDKIYTMAVCGDKFVVGTAGRRVLVWDLRNLAYVQQRRESSLKYQTRCIRCFPNKQGYVLSSIEGRVSVEYFDPDPEIQKKKYAFKCHRKKDENTGIEMIYPVNAIAFHSVHNTFVTGGSDGFVNLWDGFNKKRLCQFHKFPTSISSLAFSPDNNFLAIASSFLCENESVKNPLPDNIFIRKISDAEAKPK